MKDTVFFPEKFSLENGEYLNGLTVTYHSYGKLNLEKNNVIWVCHALTANSDVADWWPEMVGRNCVFDIDKYFIVCANIIGSPYGSSSPFLDKNRFSKIKTFPLITIRDMVNAHQLLANHLNIKQIYLLVGGSLGGHQALEWAIINPSFIKNLSVLATNCKHSAWGIAFNEAQRMALELGEEGLDAARAIAMLSYRNYAMYEQSQTDEDNEKIENFRSASYQRYQGEKLRKRFDAACYYVLSKAMDSHNVARGRDSVNAALSKITANTLIIGITSDILFPISEQKFLANAIQHSTFVEIESPFGHDGFLVETKLISSEIKHFLSQN